MSDGESSLGRQVTRILAGGVLMRRLIILGTLVLALAAPLAFSRAGAATAQSGPTLNVHAGYGGAQVTVEEFFPRTIRVSEGTTVTWTNRALREHTVTFLAG